MQLKSLLLSCKTIIFLITWLFTQSVYAQNKPVPFEGHWHGQGYELYLQHGFFLLQTQEKVSQSGGYQFNKEYLTLGEGDNKQVFRVIQHGNLLLLMGAEVEIQLQANKSCIPRNIYLGTISHINMHQVQDTVSSQLPDNYYN